ncbi:3'-5' exonuclease [Vagococcus vulneris]|uniref:DNA polymerase III polC-type n=1 Tax=Vagococcus vulneris TaxID=1977869 RepID=A0A430A0D7_9ENTE|nr:3'-5' exonuclease [Vagococcus vulneris]RST99777.1 exonuclease [Vagococcus vulneris]
MNFIAMDFETANHEVHSACSLALVMVKNSRIVGEYYTLLKPETPFHWRNIQVHGIHESDVADAPTFRDIWPDIQNYFVPGHLVVAHNAAFDNRILNGCLAHYNLPQAHFLSLCTVRTSRKLYKQLPNHKLNTVSDYLAISLEHHHHALDDSLACAEILLAQERDYGVEPLKKLVKTI